MDNNEWAMQIWERLFLLFFVPNLEPLKSVRNCFTLILFSAILAVAFNAKGQTQVPIKSLEHYLL